MSTHTKEYWEKYYAKNKEKIKANTRNWYYTNKNNPEYIKKRAERRLKWKELNPNYQTLYWRKRYKNDASFRLECSNTANLQRENKRGVFGKLTKNQWKAILWLHNYKCGECKTTENLSIDHVIPVSKGGTNNWRNIQVLCRSCNSKKRDKIAGINLFIPIEGNYATKILCS